MAAPVALVAGGGFPHLRGLLPANQAAGAVQVWPDISCFAYHSVLFFCFLARLSAFIRPSGMSLINLLLDLLLFALACYGINEVFGWLVDYMDITETMRDRFRLLAALLLAVVFTGFFWFSLRPLWPGMVRDARMLRFRLISPTAEQLAAARALAWDKHFHLPPECDPPKSVMRQHQCQQQENQARLQFERRWQQQLQAGKLPPELGEIQ